jgi:hypothetical protein
VKPQVEHNLFKGIQMNQETGLQNDIIDRYGKCPVLLQNAVRRLTESDLDLSEGAGSWTIRQIIHHIVDGDDIWKLFIKRAIGQSNGTFDLSWYWQVPEQEYWSQAWGYADRAIAPSLALFRASRAHIVQILRLIPGSLDRHLTICKLDGSEERVSVQDVVEMQTRHVVGHIADIRKIYATHSSK